MNRRGLHRLPRYTHESVGKLAHDSVDTLRAALTCALGVSPRGTTYYVRSGSRRIWFYWFFKTHRLGATVRRIKTRRFSVARDLIAEALAAELTRSRSCPRCGAAFERKGRQRFCTEACGTAWRVAKFRVHRKAAVRREARYAAEAAEAARPETQAELRRHEFEARAEYRKQRKAEDRASAKLLRFGRR